MTKGKNKKKINKNKKSKKPKERKEEKKKRFLNFYLRCYAVCLIYFTRKIDNKKLFIFFYFNILNPYFYEKNKKK